MPSQILRRTLPLLALLLLASSTCTKSVCESATDCPVGSRCNEAGACVKKACAVDTDCLSGMFCDVTGQCKSGCRSSAECRNGEACLQNKCWTVSTPADSPDGAAEDGGAEDGGDDDGGGDDGAASICRCLQAPRVCLKDINPASSKVGMLVCEPGAPPRATVLFFGNVGCSHCQHIFGNLLLMEAQLRSEGFDPALVFVQLKDMNATGPQVASTFPTHQGPVLHDTSEADMWGAYGAEWYDVKILDSHGCLSALFTVTDTANLMSEDKLLPSGLLVKEAWKSAMSPECHGLPDAGLGGAGGP